jgi:hypothetical protein
MEPLSREFGWVLVLGVIAFFSQAYFWRRKMQRMADNEIKRVDPEEWKRHVKFNRYVKLVSRSLWGSLFILWAVRHVIIMQSEGFLAFTFITTSIGTIFLTWAILGFRADTKAVNALD